MNEKLFIVPSLLNGVGPMNAAAKIMAKQMGTDDPDEVWRGINSGEYQIVKTTRVVLAGLLEEEGTIELPAHKRFVVRENFVENTDSAVPISYLGDNLKANFLDLVEENVPAMTAKRRKLLKALVDEPIVNALGDTIDKIEKARMALAHVFDTLKTADRSKWYIFYVADKNATVWAVNAYWRDVGWRVEANSVRRPRRWIVGDCVVSR
ncbi:MAG TPA: hypothetical protein VF829_02095 [Candidatus Paceibacterota bacterium]